MISRIKMDNFGEYGLELMAAIYDKSIQDSAQLIGVWKASDEAWESLGEIFPILVQCEDKIYAYGFMPLDCCGDDCDDCSGCGCNCEDEECD